MEGKLSKREMEIAVMLANDLNGTDASQKLGISIHTAQSHIRVMRAKFGKKTIAGLIAELFRKNLIS